MEGNRVIGLEMSIEPGRGDWAGDDSMPDAQQTLYFNHATQLITNDDIAEGDNGLVFLFITDNRGQLQTKFEELEATDSPITAGVVVNGTRKKTWSKAVYAKHRPQPNNSCPPQKSVLSTVLIQALSLARVCARL